MSFPLHKGRSSLHFLLGNQHIHFMPKRIGILTAGGDSPGLNAAIRGLAENHAWKLGKSDLAGTLTVGGTIFGTGRDKPPRMEIRGRKRDMRDQIVRNYKRNRLDGLICLGGGGTHKNALRLIEKGLNLITLPKTIDNDLVRTDCTIGFDTALDIATEAIDRLHRTAHSHHRIIIGEVMGWLMVATPVVQCGFFARGR
jgi:ATP-dependent phosphofructokinase / diphosphate-dependent phosphofructokinase